MPVYYLLCYLVIRGRSKREKCESPHQTVCPILSFIRKLVETMRMSNSWLKNRRRKATFHQPLSSIMCSSDNKSCTYWVCAKCSYNEVEVETPPRRKRPMTWHRWIRKPVTEGQESYINFVDTQSGKYVELLNLCDQDLDSPAKHSYNCCAKLKA